MLIQLLFAPGGAEGGNPLATLLMFGGIIAIFYFLLIRPQRQQQKAHDAMVKALTKGDEITTVGGIIGKIIHISDDRITIRTASDTRLDIERDKVGRKLTASRGGSEG
ncbi:MAG: preprotein translocase subunit YajC [Gemmatimonadota bacterium]